LQTNGDTRLESVAGEAMVDAVDRDTERERYAALGDTHVERRWQRRRSLVKSSGATACLARRSGTCKPAAAAYGAGDRDLCAMTQRLRVSAWSRQGTDVQRGSYDIVFAGARFASLSGSEHRR
jgi:hypothetical protein